MAKAKTFRDRGGEEGGVGFRAVKGCEAGRWEGGQLEGLVNVRELVGGLAAEKDFLGLRVESRGEGGRDGFKVFPGVDRFRVGSGDLVLGRGGRGD